MKTFSGIVEEIRYDFREVSSRNKGGTQVLHTDITLKDPRGIPYENWGADISFSNNNLVSRIALGIGWLDHKKLLTANEMELTRVYVASTEGIQCLGLIELDQYQGETQPKTLRNIVSQHYKTAPTFTTK